ncbi:retron St85 family RNA-directed DNA polymerase [Chromobacterium piscinae]|uniref:retron St85 family RNA-directed DNA polymerase n=1 Tax=Chromobacterium piscinae TaxID=686831 RepID=UPI003209B717
MNLIKKLAIKLGKSEGAVYKFLKGASRRYKVYSIPKRTSGHRVIAQPSKELKFYQKNALEIFKFPIHDSAMAYRAGISIKENAEKHSKNSYLLKMDLENFFNSIGESVFWREWAEFFDMPDDHDKSYINQLFFWCPSKLHLGKLILSVGAPSSPVISNFVMHRFDAAVEKECKELGIHYTRYADDMTFSSNKNGVLFEIPTKVEEILHTLFSGLLRINKRKTVFSSKAHNRHITGVTINNSGYLSIGRKQKRYIKHLVHNFSTGDLTKEDFNYLTGYLSYAKHIDASFFFSLCKKHSHNLIEKIMRGEYGI